MAALSPSPTVKLISTSSDLQAFLSSIPDSSTLYLHCEGKNLSRGGTLTIVTIRVDPIRVIALIDVQTLGESAFTTANDKGTTLKTILQDPRISKCLWDVRNDVDALWVLFRVPLSGLMDVQLLENASRTGDQTYLREQDMCIRHDLRLGAIDLYQWTKTKKEVQALIPNDIFAQRPLDAKTTEYCANDVKYLPALRDMYTRKLSKEWMGKVIDESARRAVDARSTAYQPVSEKKMLGPWGSGSNE